MDKAYRASLSRSQGREGWSVIFRHPARPDPATGRPPRRVRMGLGETDRGLAEQFVEELNQLLSDQSYWQASARQRAETQFSERVVEIFYHNLARRTKASAWSAFMCWMISDAVSVRGSASARVYSSADTQPITPKPPT